MFSVWDGYATGKNIELDPGNKIVQSWRASDWQEGIESEVTYILQENNDETIIDFHQTGIPDEFYNDIKQGWEDYYWQPLKTYFIDKD